VGAATRGRQSPRGKVTPVLQGTPVCVWVEKAVHRLKPEKGGSRVRAVGKGLPPEPLPLPTHLVGSCCGLKLPATFTTLWGFSGPP
jgi:hypothetical protein